MQIFNKLTPYDKQVICDYVQEYASISLEKENLKDTLTVWNKNKRTLTKALGGKLRVKVPVDLTKEPYLVDQELSEIYLPPSSVSAYVCSRILKSSTEKTQKIAQHFYWYAEEVLKYDFVFNLICFVFENEVFGKDPYKYCDFIKLFRLTNIRTNVLSNNVTFHIDGKKYCAYKQKGKTMKFIQKLVMAMQYPDLKGFEKWRNQISDVLTKKSFKANLVLSVHPLDFMSMSNNNCRWTSCVSWKTGIYASSVLEMLNSNNVILAYLESEKNFFVQGKKVPNKSWRTLVYVTKDIICVGKNYPFSSEVLSKKVLEEISLLVEKNLHWKYQYKNQPYFDLLSSIFDCNSDLKEYCRFYNTKQTEHKIILYTKSFYNDLVEDKSLTYYCNRNYVAKNKYIRVSGDATCLICGQKLEYDEHRAYTPDGLGESMLCSCCEQDYFCECCGKINQEKKYNLDGKEVCENCLSDYRYSLGLRQFVHKDELKNRRIVVFDKGLSDTQYQVIFSLKVSMSIEEQSEICTKYRISHIVAPIKFLAANEEIKDMLDSTLSDVKILRSKYSWEDLCSYLKTVPARDMFL